MKPLSILIAAGALTIGAAVAVPAPAQARTFVSFGINTGPGYGYYGPRYYGARYYDGYYGGYYAPRYRYRGWDRGYRGWDRGYRWRDDHGWNRGYYRERPYRYRPRYRDGW